MVNSAPSKLAGFSTTSLSGLTLFKVILKGSFNGVSVEFTTHVLLSYGDTTCVVGSNANPLGAVTSLTYK